MSQLLTFSKFYTAEEAEQFALLLKSQNIPSEIIHDKDSLDKIYILCLL